MNKKSGSSWAQKYANWVVRWRWYVIVFTILAASLLGSGIKHTQFNGDYSVFFGKDNPQLKEFVELTATYTKIDNIVFAIEPKSGEVFTNDTLKAVKELTERSWLLPFVIRVDSITNFQYSYAEGDDLVVQDLVEGAGNFSNQELERIREIALSEPFLNGQLINDDTKVTGVNVTFQLPGKAMDEIPRAVAEAKKMVADMENKYDIKIHLTGMVMLSDALMGSSAKDMSTLVPLMYAIILVVTWLILRSFTALSVTFTVIVFAVLAGMGFAGFFGIKLTPISAASPTIIMPLAVADSIHILMAMFASMRRGLSKNEALRESVRLNMWPVFLTSATTAIGFLSMNFSDAPPFHDLGNMVAVGVMAAFVLSITLCPALLAVLPVRVPKGNDMYSRSMEKLGGFVVSHQKSVLIGSVIISVIVIAFVPMNELNDNFMSYYDESMQFRNDTDFVNDNLTGIYLIQYSLKSERPNGVSDPEFLRKVDEFVEFMRAQPEVRHVNSLSDTIKRLNKNLHGDDENYYKLPEDPKLSAQYLLLYEMSLPYGLDLNNQLNVSKSSTQVLVTVEDIPSLGLQSISERGTAWLKENAGITAYGVGPAIMFAYIAQRNIYSMLEGTAVAILLISLIIMPSLRSYKLGVACLIPNLLPAALAAGIWGLFVTEVNVAVAMVASVVLGIVVDGTVHFLSKYSNARKQLSMSSEQAVMYSFSTVGVAIISTSVILILGFSVLSLSSFGMNNNMGMLTTIAIVMALFADMLLLPALLMWMDKSHRDVTDTTLIPNEGISDDPIAVQQNDL